MKTAKRKPDRCREVFYVALDSPAVTRALTRMTVAFPIINGRGTRFRYLRKELMGKLLVRLALANIEVLAPRLRAMIDYCEAEGMNQTDHLESLIRTKFAKNLHLDDDDDQGESAVHLGLVMGTTT